MPTAETLRALLAQVEEAKAGSRELDAGVWYALVEKPRPGDKLDRDIIGKWPAYTTSIDAALALVAKVLPGSQAPDILSDAIERMTRGGWKADQPAIPQLALCIIAEALENLASVSTETAHVER